MKFKNILILAGGNSTRFWPLSHKVMLPFLGKTLIEHQLEMYSQYAESLIVTTNQDTYDEIHQLAQKWHAHVFIQNGDGQSAAILSAREQLSGETFVVNGNDVFHESLLQKLVDKKSEGEIDGIFSAVKLDEYFPGGYLMLEDDTVTGIMEKPGADNMPSPYYKFVADYFNNIDDFTPVLQQATSEHDDVYEVALTQYIQSGKRFGYIEYDEKWATLKYPWHVLDVSEYFLGALSSHKASSADVHASAIIQGDVFIDEGAKVYEYAKIIGPSYIGKNAIIGNYALINSSMIGEESVIGGYSEITRSYVGPSVWTHRAYIGDSVIQGPANFGAGSVTANLRFDKKTVGSLVKGERIDSSREKLGVIVGTNVEVGVNASIMPGVKLAPNSSVMPGTVVFKDNV